MADTITARGSDAKYLSHPAGQFVATCVDTIDLGDKLESFPGTPDKLVHKCAIVFRTGERNEQTGEYIDIAREFTVSMGEKANLRKFLEQWRGKAYTVDQIEEGVPLHKLAGNAGLLTIAQQTSKQGRTYAVINACVGVPKQMAGAVEQHGDYKRADYWQTRKDEYAEGARKFRAEHQPPSNDDDFTPAFDEYSNEVDLPF